MINIRQELEVAKKASENGLSAIAITGWSEIMGTCTRLFKKC